MRLFTFRLIVGIVAFFVGAFAVFIWYFENQKSFNIISLDFPISENETILDNSTLDDSSKDEYEIYSTIITARKHKNGSVAVNERTGCGLIVDNFNFKSIKGLSNEAILDFQKKKEINENLINNFITNVEVFILKESEERQIFQTYQNGPVEFHKRYPKTRVIINFSRVGFNKKRTQALVFVGIDCGNLCGESKVIFLNKNNGKWFLQQEEILLVV
ncbi:MAG TPA: hypothetical protein PKY82_21830 [Pyrinomonadaceae bacterium]|nr:hypothetical protein [Pyrinomonadaceae bacterium]